MNITPDLQPNFTGIPNIILDQLLPQVDGSCEKVIRVICRHTYGWHKVSDTIARKQLVDETGLTESTVKRAVKWLSDNNIIERKIGGGRIATDYNMQYDVSKWRGVKITLSKNEPSEGVEIIPIKTKLNKAGKSKKALRSDPVIQSLIEYSSKYLGQELTLTEKECKPLFGIVKAHTLEKIERAFIQAQIERFNYTFKSIIYNSSNIANLAAKQKPKETKPIVIHDTKAAQRKAFGETA